MIELDWKGTNCCLYNQVENTKSFKKYIEEAIGFIDSQLPGGCDLQILCNKVCGVNLGIGYYGYHTNKERLVLSEWENTLSQLSKFLEKEHKRFKLSFFKVFIKRFKRIVLLPFRIMKKIFKLIFKKQKTHA